MRAWAVTLLVAFLLSLPGGLATAQGDVNREIAKKHYELGEKLYQFKNYQKALSEFRQAYELAPIPALMFNMGRCHEKMANHGEAVSHYQRFLAANPGASNRDDVEARIKAAQAEIQGNRIRRAWRAGCDCHTAAGGHKLTVDTP